MNMTGPSQPRVRDATKKDVPAILPLVRAICDLHAAKDPERFAVLDDVLERYSRWLPERVDDSTSVLLVAEDESGRIVGYLVGTVEPEVPIFWIPKCGWVHDIFVMPEARRLGLGDLLMVRAIKHFEEQGLRQMRLHTGGFNDASRAFFARHGFRQSVIEMLRPIEPRREA